MSNTEELSDEQQPMSHALADLIQELAPETHKCLEEFVQIVHRSGGGRSIRDCCVLSAIISSSMISAIVAETGWDQGRQIQTAGEISRLTAEIVLGNILNGVTLKDGVRH